MVSHAGHVRTSRWALGSLFALAIVVSLTAAFASRASATTKPGFVYKVPAVITDSRVLLVPHTRSGKVVVTYVRPDGRSAQFPRGTVIEFVFTNKGTKTYLPAIRVLDKSQADPYTHTKNLYTASKAITPGGHVSLFGNFYFRGSFQIEKLFNKKPQGGSVNVSIY